MQVNKTLAPGAGKDERLYIVAVTLREFQGREQVEAQIFRAHADPAEVAGLKGKNLVGAPDPAMPKELLAGATEEMALECLLETFTAGEVEQLETYLKERYGDHITEIDICPMPLPVPLGMGALGKIPEGPNSGFINFDLAPDYPLPFAVKGYYELMPAESGRE